MGFSRLKSEVNVLSNSSFSAFRAKQKSEILFWAAIRIYSNKNNNKYQFKYKIKMSTNFKFNRRQIVYVYSKLQ